VAAIDIAHGAGNFRFDLFAATLLSCLFLQIAANYFNEYFDYRYGLDHEGSLGASTVIFRNEMSAGQVLGGGIGSLVIASLFGIYLITQIGIPIIIFGLSAAAILYFYSAKPFQFSARGLGDVMVFLAMGFLMTWGSYYVQLQSWSWSVFAACIPVGCLVTAILNMNNTRDYQDDKAVDKLTLPVRFGIDFGKRFHMTLLYGAYIAATVAVIIGVLPFTSLLVWLTFPLAFANVRDVLAGQQRTAYMVGIKRTAQLHLIFGVVYAVGILIGQFVRF
jgi:1,4-dihydroxy-2-naphthoate octaprenyltransferase